MEATERNRPLQMPSEITPSDAPRTRFCVVTTPEPSGESKFVVLPKDVDENESSEQVTDPPELIAENAIPDWHNTEFVGTLMTLLKSFCHSSGASSYRGRRFCGLWVTIFIKNHNRCEALHFIDYYKQINTEVMRNGNNS